MRRVPWALLLVLLLWCILSFPQLVDPLFLPKPTEVAREFWLSMLDGRLLKHLAATLYRLAVGFAVGSAIGIPLGLTMGYSTRVYGAFEALIEICRAIPVIALFPLFLILFGLGDESKFAIAAWSTAFIVLINTMYGVQHGSQLRRMVARSLKASEWQVFWRVVLPEALPEIVVGLRTGVSIALIVILMSEMFLGTQAGLGQLIYNAHLMYDIPSMYVGILAAGLVGYCLNLFLLSLETRFVHWSAQR